MDGGNRLCTLFRRNFNILGVVNGARSLPPSGVDFLVHGLELKVGFWVMLDMCSIEEAQLVRFYQGGY